MYTSKRELAAALKLAAIAKKQPWPAFARFKASSRGRTEDSPPAAVESESAFLRRTAAEAKEAENYLGRGLMQTTCGIWESEFYFRGAWREEEITISLDNLAAAVKTLGKGDVELIAKDGFLHVWQGQECVKIGAVVLSGEIKKQLPGATLRELNRGIERWLNPYELGGIIRILKKILAFAEKADLAQAGNTIYFENRSRETEGHEDLFLAAYNGYVVAAGRQIVERLGGFGIFLMPANAARKICTAVKLLNPEGAKLRLDNNVISFEIGRAIISAKLIEDDFVNPEITFPRDIVAGFNLNRAQLTRFAKKAKAVSMDITFEYKNGVLSGEAGANCKAQGIIPAGQDKQPVENEFMFAIKAEPLCNILKGVTGDTLNIYYAGEKRPLYLAADGVSYAVMPVIEGDKK